MLILEIMGGVFTVVLDQMAPGIAESFLIRVTRRTKHGEGKRHQAGRSQIGRCLISQRNYQIMHESKTRNVCGLIATDVGNT